MKKLWRVGLVLAGTLAFTGPAHAFLFDGFGDDQGPVTDSTVDGSSVSSGPMPINDTDLSSAERTLEAELTSESGAPGDVEAETLDGFFAHRQTSGEVGYTKTSYTFDPVSFNDPLNLAINIVNNDEGGSVDFTLEDADGGSDTQTATLSPDETGSLLFTFSGLNVDLSQVNAGSFQVNGNSSLDLEAQFIEVPVPGVVGLLGLGLVGMAATVQRRARG